MEFPHTTLCFTKLKPSQVEYKNVTRVWNQVEKSPTAKAKNSSDIEPPKHQHFQGQLLT